ncbi:MAG: hypothetical protein JWQ09_3903 [Segetibacter sp.]|nr:hypothetical protein [Segetibacter sp.]
MAKESYHGYMKTKQNIRIALTAIVLLIGGYFIQKSVSATDVLSEVVDSAKADHPADTGGGSGGGGK